MTDTPPPPTPICTMLQGVWQSAHFFRQSQRKHHIRDVPPAFDSCLEVA